MVGCTAKKEDTNYRHLHFIWSCTFAPVGNAWWIPCIFQSPDDRYRTGWRCCHKRDCLLCDFHRAENISLAKEPP